MNKKKIMFLMSGLDGGGAEKVLADTLNNLDTEKYDITLILVEDRGIYIKQLSDRIKVIYLTHKDKPYQIRWLYRLLHYVPFRFVYRFYIRERYDLEIAFLEGLATHVVGCSPRQSKKIAWVHTDMMENRWSDVDFSSEKQQSYIYRNFDKIICVSDYCKNKFEERFGKGYPLSTLYNVVCDGEIKRKAEDKNVISNEKRKFTFVSSGRLIPQKGFDRLLRIHKRLLEEGYPHELWILGDGEQKKELMNIIEECKIDSTVSLLGFKDNPYPFMKAANCFVCSSRSEGYSTVVSEAFILGIPVVSVRCSGAEELLENGKYGLLVENEDDALYEGMKAILGNPQLYNQLKESAKIRGRFFSKEDRLTALEELLDE